MSTSLGAILLVGNPETGAATAFPTTFYRSLCTSFLGHEERAKLGRVSVLSKESVEAITRKIVMKLLRARYGAATPVPRPNTPQQKLLFTTSLRRMTMPQKREVFMLGDLGIDFTNPETGAVDTNRKYAGYMSLEGVEDWEDFTTEKDVRWEDMSTEVSAALDFSIDRGCFCSRVVRYDWASQLVQKDTKILCWSKGRLDSYDSLTGEIVHHYTPPLHQGPDLGDGHDHDEVGACSGTSGPSRKATIVVFEGKIYALGGSMLTAYDPNYVCEDEGEGEGEGGGHVIDGSAGGRPCVDEGEDEGHEIFGSDDSSDGDQPEEVGDSSGVDLDDFPTSAAEVAVDNASTDVAGSDDVGPENEGGMEIETDKVKVRMLECVSSQVYVWEEGQPQSHGKGDTGRWELLLDSELNYARWGHCACVHDGKIFVAGGIGRRPDGSWYTANFVESFDGTAWTTDSGCLRSDDVGSLFSLGGSLYAVVKATNMSHEELDEDDDGSAFIQVRDNETQAWTRIASICYGADEDAGVNVTVTDAFPLNGKIFFVTDQHYGEETGCHWEYHDPESTYAGMPRVRVDDETDEIIFSVTVWPIEKRVMPAPSETCNLWRCIPNPNNESFVDAFRALALVA